MMPSTRAVSTEAGGVRALVDSGRVDGATPGQEIKDIGPGE
jgi:hypothetical protein